MNLYANIKEVCRVKGKQIGAVEKQCGFSQGTINRWSAINPSIDKIIAVADCLNVSVDEICGRGFTSTPLTEGFVHELQHDLSDDENLIIQKFRTLSDADKVKFLFTMLGFEK